MAVRIASIPIQLHMSVDGAEPAEIGEFLIPVRARLIDEAGHAELESSPSLRKELKRGLRQLAKSL